MSEDSKKYECRIYWCDIDQVWVAYSVNTFQIGCGYTPVEALQDMIKAVDITFELAEEDETIQPWSK